MSAYELCIVDCSSAVCSSALRLLRRRPRLVRLVRLGRRPRLAVLARPFSHRRPVRLAGRRRRSRPAGKLPGQVQVQPPCRLAAAGRHYRQQPLDLRRVTALLRQPPEDFIRANTRLEAPPLVPEVKLHLASEVVPLWEATEEELTKQGLPPPFWAFAWAGGQALARYLLDHPEVVRGKRVLDFAAGSGLQGIAAMLAGDRKSTRLNSSH